MLLSLVIKFFDIKNYRNIYNNSKVIDFFRKYFASCGIRTQKSKKRVRRTSHFPRFRCRLFSSGGKLSPDRRTMNATAPRLPRRNYSHILFRHTRAPRVLVKWRRCPHARTHARIGACARIYITTRGRDPGAAKGTCFTRARTISTTIHLSAAAHLPNAFDKETRRDTSFNV